MSKGRYYASQSWDSFEQGAHSFVQDGFAHEKTLLFKAHLQNTNDGVTLQQTLTQRSDAISGVGQVKFWLNVQGQRYIFAKVGTQSNIVVQLDNGVRQVKNIKNLLYLGGQVNRTFTQRQIFAGIKLFQDNNWYLNSRLTFDFIKKTQQLDQKFYFNRNGWNFNGFFNIDLNNKRLARWGMLMGWTPSFQDSKWGYFLTLQSSKQSQTGAPRLPFTLAITHNTTPTQTIGIQAKFKFPPLGSTIYPKQLFQSVWLASEWQFGSSTVKAKVNSDLSHAVTVRNNLGTYGTYSLGVSASDVGSKSKLKFGMQVDLNL